jgi:hypothetical protein
MPPMIPSPPIAPAAPLGPIPGAPTDRQIAAASIIAHNYINRGEAVPPDIADILKFKYAGPTAAATAQATAPITQANQAQQAQVTARWNLWAEQNKPILARPNTLQINQNGQVYGQYEGLGDDGARHTYVMVPGPDGQAQKKDLGKTALTPEEEARQKATGGNVANLSPTNPMGAPAAATLPRVSPYGVIPPLSEQNLPASAKEAESAIPLWQTHVAEWTKGIQPAQQAEQRLLTIGQAFKSIQTGTWATEGANLAGALKAIGINLPANALTNPAKGRDAASVTNRICHDIRKSRASQCSAGSEPADALRRHCADAASAEPARCVQYLRLAEPAVLRDSLSQPEQARAPRRSG